MIERCEFGEPKIGHVKKSLPNHLKNVVVQLMFYAYHGHRMASIWYLHMQ